MRAKLLLLCLTLCDPMGCSLPGSFVHGILPSMGILEWVAIPSPRGPSWSRIEHTALMSPTFVGGFFMTSATWEPFLIKNNLSLKTRDKTTIWLNNPTNRHISTGTHNWKRHLHPQCSALFTIPRTWKQPRCPQTNEWIKKLWYVYTIDYYLAIKGNTFDTVLTRWMSPDPII